MFECIGSTFTLMGILIIYLFLCPSPTYGAVNKFEFCIMSMFSNWLQLVFYGLKSNSRYSYHLQTF